MKKVILVLSVMAFSMTAICQQQPQPQRNISVTLPLEAWSKVLQSLAKENFGDIAAIWLSINSQVNTPAVIDTTRTKPAATKPKQK